MTFFDAKVQPYFQFSSLRFNHHQMPRSTSCLFHSAQPTRKLHLFAVTCMSRSLPVFIFCIYCVPIQKLGRSLFILSRTFRFNEIGAKPNRHVGATDLWLVESRSSNKNAHNKTADGQMVQILLQLQNWFLAYDQTDTFPSNKNNHDKTAISLKLAFGNI